MLIMREQFQHLAVCLLDNEDGILENAYMALLDLGQSLDLEEDCLELNSHIEAQDGKFYLPKDHNLEWRIQEV